MVNKKISKFTEDLTIPPTNYAIYRTLSQPTSFTVNSAGKESACNAGDPCSIPGSGRCPEGGRGNSPQYSCLENPMDRGAWRATVHGVTKSWTRMK